MRKEHQKIPADYKGVGRSGKALFEKGVFNEITGLFNEMTCTGTP